MGGAVIFVMAIAGFVTACLNRWVLVPFKATFLETIVFILTIAGIVQILELLLMRFSKPLYQALGIYLPLITTNCAVLGVSLTVVTKEFNYGGVAHMLSLGESIVYAVGIALGFAMALVIFAGIREHIDLMEPPKGMKGTPIALITAGILALAFMGFTGIV
jgi:electron transport complex protein RnfA